ncbi:MAG TPA: PAS domain S-box protein [Spirochaetota bacterium]|nr:PAS domain S-box protein [Spirochaetota bacterium]
MAHTILLVEDEAILALAESDTLRRYGYAVVTAHSGAAAVSAAKDPAVDLVLMDIDLGPGMDGTEAAARILRDRDIPIVFLSSHTEPAIVEKTETITSYGYVVKDSGDTVLDASIKMAYRLFAANSELKKKEALLKESEEKYRLLYEQAGLGIGYYTPEGVVISFNEQALANMGARSEDVVGKSIHDLFPDAEAERYMGRLMQALESDESAEYEDGVDLPAGSFCFSTVFRRIRDERGSVIGVQLISKNVTERKRAEDALRESERKLHHIEKNIPGILFQARVAPGGSLRFTYVSPRAYDLFGFHLALDDPRWEPGINMHPDDRERYLQAIASAIASGGDFEFEGRFKPIEGKIPWFQAIATASRIGNELVYNGVIIDITERKLVERELEASERILALINESADLRTLMRGIAAYLYEWSGCEAIGIRLREGEDFPYFEYRGFDEEFIRLENSLCVTDLDGQLLRDDVGNPVIECMCGNVICGRIDPAKPFFTQQGSFWSNCTTELLATTTEADRQAQTRNRCNGMGYESVALIPLRDTGVTFGLLQLNDRRRDRFSPTIIRTLERIADRIAIALAHHHMRAKLEEREERFRLFVDYTYDWEYWIDPDGGFRYVSPSCERITGYSAREFMDDKDLLERIVHADDRSRYRDHIRESRSPDCPACDCTVDFRVVARTGEVRWIGHRCQPVFGVAGQWLGVRGSNRDITERKNAEQALAGSEERFRTLFEYAPVLIDAFDENGRCILWNKECERVFGWTMDDINAHEDPLALFYPDPEVRREVVSSVTAIPRNSFREWHPVTREGIELTTQWANFMLPDGMVINIGMDFTERRKAEEALAAALEEKTALLAELQHRVKNSLALISSLVSLQASGAADDSTRAVLMDVESRIMSIARLYGQLYESGGYARIDLRDYLTRIINGVQMGYMARQGVRIRASIDFATCSFKTASSLGIILNELLTNAFKYAFPGERTGAVSVSLTRKDESFALHVEDDGAGLPPGFDLESSQGMGMQLVRLLAKQHRGAAVVDPGGRASFTVTVVAD